MSSFKVGDPSRANDDQGVDNSTRQPSPAGGTPGIPDAQPGTEEPPRVVARAQGELEDPEPGAEVRRPGDRRALRVEAASAASRHELLDPVSGVEGARGRHRLEPFLVVVVARER